MTRTIDSTRPATTRPATTRSATTRSATTEAAEPDPTGDIMADFRATMTQLKCASSERLLRLGVSMAQVHIMYTVQRSGEMTMSHLAEVLNVSFSSATGLIDRMEERGIVERVRHPEDRRVVLVRVSDAGRRILADVEVLRDDLVARILARLDTPRLARMAEVMEDLRGAIVAIAADEPELFAHTHAHPHGAGVGASARPAAEK